MSVDRPAHCLPLENKCTNDIYIMLSLGFNLISYGPGVQPLISLLNSKGPGLQLFSVIVFKRTKFSLVIQTCFVFLFDAIGHFIYGLNRVLVSGHF